MNRILVVRHGQTDWNAKNIMHGQTDVPLNQLGIKQAEDLMERLQNVAVDICYCTHLSRSEETARIILQYHPNVDLLFDDRLLELYKGNLEGTNNNSEHMLLDESLDILKQFRVESKAHFYNRVKSFYDEILEKYNNKTILIVAHSGTVKMSEFYFNAPNKDIVSAYYDLHIPNGYVAQFGDDIKRVPPVLRQYDVNREVYPFI